MDSRTLRSSPESWDQAGYAGYKRRNESEIHLAVDTFGHLLTLLVIPANEQDRAQVKALTDQIQEITGEMVKIAFVDQGYTGADPAADATAA